ncbi:redoxin domain-containing protein [Mucilaginibacter sp. X5P1]|uniref:TlpA disulfide reductase family protein n=1 Tax=Mucilaginibacter sp. X5P1 TaxID=2723088 RepID=UPI0016179262|nr:TlpA disulfide reductase family protein [Mucilaginibacter sp. X5P1]MBB6136998.1 thiol-disulfide isomerase/thioredoxin [Mucilaginibacter sp. X5P1]
MRKMIIGATMVGLLISQQGFSQSTTSKQFTLKGSLTGTHVDSALLYYADAAGNYAHASQPILNNEFSISGNISHASSARIIFKNKGEVIPRMQMEDRMREFYIEPGTLQLTGDAADLKSLKLSGSATEAEFEQLEAKTAPIRAEMKPLEEAFMKEKDHEKAAALHDQFEPYQSRIKKVTYQFFTDHPNSYVTLDMMRYYVSSMSLDSIKAVYNSFNDDLKSSPEGKELAGKIKSIESGLPGSVAPLFSKTDINGKPLSLADFKGKYVILDFWASWCVPCRKSNPHMIELYKKYHDKGFDVVGIADDDGKTAVWNAAVTKDGVGIWHNVLRGLNFDMIMKHIENPNDLDEQYGIASIPTKILIDPSGKIIGRFGDSYGGTEEDMDKMLTSIFDK